MENWIHHENYDNMKHHYTWSLTIHSWPFIIGATWKEKRTTSLETISRIQKLSARMLLRRCRSSNRDWRHLPAAPAPEVVVVVVEHVLVEVVVKNGLWMMVVVVVVMVKGFAGWGPALVAAVHTWPDMCHTCLCIERYLRVLQVPSPLQYSPVQQPWTP